eukprot:UN01214
MATFDVELIKKGQLGQLNKFLETNSFIDGVVVSQKDFEIFKLINNGFDQKKNNHVARWYNYFRQLAPSVIAALPADGQIVFTSSSSSSASSGSSSGSGSSSSGSSSSGSSDSSEDEATKKRKEKEARWARNIAKEQSNVVFDITARPDVDIDALLEKIRAIERPSLIWAVGHEIMDMGYGVKCIRIGTTITNVLVDVDDLQGEILEWEDEVRDCKIVCFQKI